MSRARKALRLVFDWVRTIIMALLVWGFLRTFVIEAFRISSGSMQNTLMTGDFLFVNKFLYGAEVPLLHTWLPAVREPMRGDILVFDSVEEADKKIVKRLVGLPGDTLAMRGGALFLNGEPQFEPYLMPPIPGMSADPIQRARMRRWQSPHLVGGPTPDYRPNLQDWGPIIVPADSLFVLGDNRDDSYDGRYWGFLPRRHLRGSPVIIHFSIRAERTGSLWSDVRWNRLFHVPQ